MPFPFKINPQNEDEYFMLEALKEAWKAFQKDEVPVGAVLVKEKHIIARGHSSELLQTVGKTLREQAANYLEENFDNDEVNAALLAAIVDHNEVVKQNIEEEEQVIPYIEEDIEELLKRENQTPDVKIEIEEKQKQIEIKNESIKLQQKDILGHDLQAYIDMSRKDGFYCGTAQIYALCKLYNIHAKVFMKYHTPQPIEKSFNEKCNTTPLYIGHVNNNHFQYVEVDERN